MYRAFAVCFKTAKTDRRLTVFCHVIAVYAQNYLENFFVISCIRAKFSREFLLNTAGNLISRPYSVIHHPFSVKAVSLLSVLAVSKKIAIPLFIDVLSVWQSWTHFLPIRSVSLFFHVFSCKNLLRYLHNTLWLTWATNIVGWREQILFNQKPVLLLNWDCL